ncbi:hypothetical protein LA080_005776 [Diaporthe eres]|nr:hypothetical protein LA080_005776 [Diaporthe eres]
METPQASTMQVANATLSLNLIVSRGIRFLANGLDCQMYDSRAHVLGYLVVGDTIHPLQLNRANQSAPHAKKSPLPDHRSIAPLAHFPGGTSLGSPPNECASA